MFKDIEITDVINKEYLKNPNHCPFCGSDNITAKHFDAGDYDIAYRDISCLNPECRIEWTEQFMLMSINNAFKIDYRVSNDETDE
jgi:hypothetical protein